MEEPKLIWVVMYYDGKHKWPLVKYIDSYPYLTRSDVVNLDWDKVQTTVERMNDIGTEDVLYFLEGLTREEYDGTF